MGQTCSCFSKGHTPKRKDELDLKHNLNSKEINSALMILKAYRKYRKNIKKIGRINLKNFNEFLIKSSNLISSSQIVQEKFKQFGPFKFQLSSSDIKERILNDPFVLENCSIYYGYWDKEKSIRD